MQDDKGRLLDLVAKRYPTTKPSDYMPHLDEYDAWQLDSALALRYSLEEKEDFAEHLHIVKEHIKGLMKVLGAKGIKVKQYERQFSNKPKKENNSDDDLPLVSDIMKSLGGK